MLGCKGRRRGGGSAGDDIFMYIVPRSPLPERVRSDRLSSIFGAIACRERTPMAHVNILCSFSPQHCSFSYSQNLSYWRLES